MSSIASGTTTTTALVQTADTTGNLLLQTGSTPTTAVTIDTSQNVGIQTTPSAWSSFSAIQLANGAYIGQYTPTASVYVGSNNYYNGSNFIYTTTGYASIFKQINGQHQFLIAPSGTAGTSATMTQAMTLNNSGALLVGGTTATNGGFHEFFFNGNTYNGLVLNDTTATSGTYFQIFSANGTGCGAITRVGATSAVVYGTTSDRRLKTNIADLTNSGVIIDSLKPRTFTWLLDGSADVGFIADELQSVIPKAVTGQPNATTTEEYEITPAIKDEQGNITTPAVMETRTVPNYQMVDASTPEMIAYLVAEVQSLRARLKAANIA